MERPSHDRASSKERSRSRRTRSRSRSRSPRRRRRRRLRRRHDDDDEDDERRQSRHHNQNDHHRRHRSASPLNADPGLFDSIATECFVAAALGDAAALARLLDGALPPSLRAVLLGGTRTDASGSTLLHEAARHNRLAAAQALLEHGADASARDRAGRTAAEVARARGHAGVAALLAAGGGEEEQQQQQQPGNSNWWRGYDEEEEDGGGNNDWERRLFDDFDDDDEEDEDGEGSWAARAWARVRGGQRQPMPGAAREPPLRGAGLLSSSSSAGARAPAPVSMNHQAPPPQADWRARMEAEVAASGMARGVAAAKREQREREERRRAEEEQERRRRRQQQHGEEAQAASSSAVELPARRREYEARWRALEARLGGGGGRAAAAEQAAPPPQLLLSLADVPWPLATAAATAAASPDALRALLLAGVDGPKALRARLREELLRWHPDKASWWLRALPEGGGARGAATAASQAVARALTTLIGGKR
jgi:NF-kappa-B inhibitor-like protein 1